MLGSQIPHLVLTFFDDNQNESCAFSSPDEDSDDIELESRDDLENDSVSSSTYWVKILSRSKNFKIEVERSNSKIMTSTYPISKVYKVYLISVNVSKQFG